MAQVPLDFVMTEGRRAHAALGQYILLSISVSWEHELLSSSLMVMEKMHSPNQQLHTLYLRPF